MRKELNIIFVKILIIVQNFTFTLYMIDLMRMFSREVSNITFQ